MGRGITRIRNYDGEMVNTFIIELHNDFEETKRDYLRNEHFGISHEYIKEGMTFAEKRRAVLHLYMDRLLPITVSDERIYDRMNELDDDEIANIAYAVAELDAFERLTKRESDENRVSGWHGCGVIIAKSKNCLLVIDNNESDYVIGCIPTEKMGNILDNVRNERYDELYEEAEAELEKTRKRADANYEITRDDVDSLAEQKVAEAGEKAWEEYVEKYRADANAAMRKVHEFLGAQSMRVPTSAWTSAKMKTYDEMTEEERNSYY